MNNNFSLLYPHAAALGLNVVDAGPGFDVLELEAKLGKERIAQLMAGVAEVFCANHSKYPDEHELAGCEVHCVYARDLEAFLAAEGK